MLEIIQIPALGDNYIYLLRDQASGDVAVVDPAEAEPVLAVLKDKGWRLALVLITHHHADHVGGNLALQRETGCRIVGAGSDRHRIPGIGITVMHGDKVSLGDQTLDVIATPGHTSGHIVYYCAAAQALFCGDTLFSLGCGRLFEGSAEEMWRSLQALKALPAATRIYCAHEYTLANARFALSVEADNAELQRRAAEVGELRRRNLSTLPSSLAQELATNPFLREDSPAIRRALGISGDSSSVQAFAEIRLRKDHFR